MKNSGLGRGDSTPKLSSYEEYAIKTRSVAETDLREIIAKIKGGSLNAEDKKSLLKDLAEQVIDEL